MLKNLAIKPESEAGEVLAGRVNPDQMFVIIGHSQLLELINNGEHTFVGWMVID